MVDQLNKFSIFVPLEAVGFMRRIDDLKERPLQSVSEVHEMVTEPDTEVFPHEVHLDQEIDELDSEADPSSNTNNAPPEEASIETKITTYPVENTKGKW